MQESPDETKLLPFHSTLIELPEAFGDFLALTGKIEADNVCKIDCVVTQSGSFFLSFKTFAKLTLFAQQSVILLEILTQHVVGRIELLDEISLLRRVDDEADDPNCEQE